MSVEISLKPKPGDEKKPPIPAKILGYGALVFIIFYQIILMWIWVAFKDLDWVLMRISLSMADAITIFALILSFYAYFRYEVSTENKDMLYLHTLVVALRKSGMKAGLLLSMGTFMNNIQKAYKEETGEDLLSDPDLATFLGHVVLPVEMKKIKAATKRVKDGKCEWKDYQEALK